MAATVVAKGKNPMRFAVVHCDRGAPQMLVNLALRTWPSLPIDSELA
jgi:hypothetical protein